MPSLRSSSLSSQASSPRLPGLFHVIEGPEPSPLDKPKPLVTLSWRTLMLIACVWLVLALTALVGEVVQASAPRSNATYMFNGTSLPEVHPEQSFTLTVLLLLLAALWFVAASLTCAVPAHEVVLTVPRHVPSLGVCLILCGGLALCFELVARLVCARQFGGRVSAFVFGIKCKTGVEGCEHELNFPFAPEFNSFGHCIQGCLTLFLFPGWLRLLQPVRRRPAVPLLLQGASAPLLIVYPVYNVIKRALKHGEDFASSSFANNGAEWATGFVLGLSTCVACSAAEKRWTSPLSGEETSGSGDLLLPRVWCRGVWATLVNSGLLLCAVAIVAAVMFGLTWDNTPVEEHDDDNVDVLMLAVMLTVCVWFAGGVVAVAYFARKRRGDELHLSRGPQRGLNATMPYEASPANTCSDRGSAAHLQVSDKL